MFYEKTIKQTLAIAMTTATLLAVPVASMSVSATENSSSLQTADSESYDYVENHSIIDCTNRYKMNDGNYNFTIKLPAGTDLNDVTLEITRDDKGTNLFSDNLFYFSVPGVFGTNVTFKESYDGSDYYEFVTHKFVNAGIGIKLYMRYNDVNYMSTDNANGSTTQGRGYWLSA